MSCFGHTCILIYFLYFTRAGANKKIKRDVVKNATIGILYWGHKERLSLPIKRKARVNSNDVHRQVLGNRWPFCSCNCELLVWWRFTVQKHNAYIYKIPGQISGVEACPYRTQYRRKDLFKFMLCSISAHLYWEWTQGRVGASLSQLRLLESASGDFEVENS